MDYSKLADELFEAMQTFHKIKPMKHIDENLRGEAFVLGYIAQHGGDVLPGEIGAATDVSSARVAATLNNLEKKGLITRSIDKTDRRRILVGITKEGMALADEHFLSVRRAVSCMLELLGERDATEFIRIVKRLSGLLPDKIDYEKQDGGL